jgi:hypothetical protein
MQVWARAVGVFSDIHSSDLALAAVLHAAQVEGMEALWCLGDLLAHGPRILLGLAGYPTLAGRLTQCAPVPQEGPFE